MTRVKICGITSVNDALMAVRAGAHALGFVFADSPRRVEPGQVRRIVRVLPPYVSTVGVFVDAPAGEVEDFLDRSGVQIAQLHGRESPRDCAAVSRPVIKRIPIDHHVGSAAVREECHRFGVSGLLLDPGAGNGRPFDWTPLAALASAETGISTALGSHVVLAGGLNPENVAEAISLLRPYAVDVCTGVETAPGIKDPAKLRAFIEAVEKADALCLA